MTEVENFQTKDPNNFDINEADRFSIKAAIKRGTIHTNDLSIQQRKDLIEDYLIEQGHTVFGECDEINYLEHLIKQPLSIELKKLVGQQLAAVTIQNYDVNKLLTEIVSQQIKSREQQILEQNDENPQTTIQNHNKKETKSDNQPIDKNNDIRTLLTKPKGSVWESIKTSIKSAIESIKNNKGAVLPSLAAVSFGVIVAGLVVAFATTLPIFVGISIACIGIAALISSLSATIVHYYENL